MPSLLSTLKRKAVQGLHDPVLRSWLWGRGLGRWLGSPPFTSGRPIYLNDAGPLTAESTPADLPYIEVPDAPPTEPVALPLPR